MQSLTKTLLLLPFLLTAACDAEIDNSEPDGMGNTGIIDTVRVELEVVGPGKIAIVSPEQAECTEARRICTFEFERGTEIYLEGDFSGHSVGGWAEDCIGRDLCRLTLHRDTLVVASFGEEPDRGGPDKEIPESNAPDNLTAYNEAPGDGVPDVIVDPFTGTLHESDTPDNRTSYNEAPGYGVPGVIVDPFTGAPHGHRAGNVAPRDRSF